MRSHRSASSTRGRFESAGLSGQRLQAAHQWRIAAEHKPIAAVTFRIVGKVCRYVRTSRDNCPGAFLDRSRTARIEPSARSDEVSRRFKNLHAKGPRTFRCGLRSHTRDSETRTRIQDVVQLAQAIAQSGEIFTCRELGRFGAASTGVRRLSTTLLCPLLLAATRQVRVPKVSATGSVAGAIDTLALIPGFQSKLNRDQFLNALENAGIAHTEQTETFCPADAVLFDHRRLVDMTRHTG